MSAGIISHRCNPKAFLGGVLLGYFFINFLFLSVVTSYALNCALFSGLVESHAMV